MERRCSGPCKRTAGEGAVFWSRGVRVGGQQSRCRDCMRAVNREWQRKQRARRREIADAPPPETEDVPTRLERRAAETDALADDCADPTLTRRLRRGAADYRSLAAKARAGTLWDDEDAV